MSISSFFSSDTLGKQWKEAKSKVDSAVLKEMKLQDDFGPELDKLEKARDDISGWVDSIVKAGADVEKLRTSLLQTCTSYKLKAEGKNLSSLVTAIDGLRGQVESLTQEVGKVVEAAKSVKRVDRGAEREELSMRRKLHAVTALIMIFVCASLAARGANAAEVQLTPLVADVLSTPRTVSGSDGDTHLVYELRLSNATPLNAELRKVEVLDAATGKTLHTLERDAIAKRFSIGGRRGAESADVAVGQFGVVFVHVTLPGGAAVPKSIVHKVSLRLVQPGIDVVETVGQSEVVDVPVLGPPLIGKGYVAADGCCDSTRHVRALLPLNGRFALAQRFAIDWEQIDAQNRLVSGDLKDVKSYVIFGKDVLAVAGGTVVASRNDLPEQVPGSLPKDLPIDEADGNFVIQDIGNGAYVLYAHMQPGSVKMKSGATVKRGDVLGQVGNTGNTSAPHLHLHVMDGPEPLLANGIPYVFESFTLTAIDKAGTADFDKAEATGSPLALTSISPPQPLRKVLPLDLTVVEFSR